MYPRLLRMIKAKLEERLVFAFNEFVLVLEIALCNTVPLNKKSKFRELLHLP